MMLALLILSMAIGFLGFLGGLGFDVIDALTKAYPFGFSDSARSIFSKRAGPAILFAFPIALSFCVVYAKVRATEVIKKYDSFDMAPPTWLIASYSIGMILSVFVIAVVSRDSRPILGFFGQFAAIAFFRVVVVEEIRRRFKIAD
jgi:RsiW-degrading membrane proteinase PrsW (M82 family)